MMVLYAGVTWDVLMSTVWPSEENRAENKEEIMAGTMEVLMGKWEGSMALKWDQEIILCALCLEFVFQDQNNSWKYRNTRLTITDLYHIFIFQHCSLSSAGVL